LKRFADQRMVERLHGDARAAAARAIHQLMGQAAGFMRSTNAIAGLRAARLRSRA
jgi:hypothetical protein